MLKLATFKFTSLRKQLAWTVIFSLIGKFSGFIRIQQIASTLGPSIQTDALLIAFQFTWFFETTLITSAVVPILVSKYYQVEKDEGAKFSIKLHLHLMFCCLVITTLFSLAMFLFSNKISFLLAPGLSSYGQNLIADFLLVSALSPVLLALAHFLGLINRLLQNGAWYSITQIVTNIAAVFGLLIGHYHLGPIAGARSMLIFFSIGIFIVCLLQLWAIPHDYKKKFFAELKSNYRSLLLNQCKTPVWFGIFTLLAASIANELFIYIDFYFASRLVDGSVSLLGFGTRLAALSNMVIIGTAFVVLEPRWAKHVSDIGLVAWSVLIKNDILILLSLMALPFCILLNFTDYILDLLFQSSSFSQYDQNRLVNLTRIFAFGSVALALNMITIRSVVIAGKQKWLLFSLTATLPLKILLNNMLISYFHLYGLAVSTILVLLIQSMINIIVINFKKHILNFNFLDMIKILMCYFVMTFLAFILSIYFIENIFVFIVFIIVLSLLMIILILTLYFTKLTIFKKRI